MNKNKFSTKYLVEMALLVAIILLMAFTPIGLHQNNRIRNYP